MTSRLYESPEAFKQALEMRLRKAFADGTSMSRRRQLLVFERRERPNSRVKDLPDMALLAAAKKIDAACLREAIRATFAYRGTHAPPHALAPPPAVWEAPYARMAKDGSLPWLTLAAVTQAAQAFLDPLLLGIADSVWDSASWSWRPKPTA